MIEVLVIGVIAALMLLLALVFGLANYLWWAWWVYPAWGWFVEPLGVPHVSIWAFVGVIILLHGKPDLWVGHSDTKTRTGAEWIGTLIGAVSGPVVVWAILRWLHWLAV